MKHFDFSIKRLGGADIPSPLGNTVFVPESARIIYSVSPESILAETREFGSPLSFEQAGPRGKIFHSPGDSRAAILTAGGICPGLNDVIKGVVNTLYQSYGVTAVYGIKYGYRGLIPEYGYEPVPLDPDLVDELHTEGGTVLGSSRGEQDIGRMVDTLERMKINLLFCIGGDGTLRGAHRICDEIEKRGLKISVIGVPKTIDNDISFIHRTFGFETAVYATHSIIASAHNEAKGVYNGVGLIQVMGRDSGFIAAYATLANTDVNYCFIPEVPFALDGPNGFLVHLKKRLERKQHAVIMIAEGAGQHLFADKTRTMDASGNIVHKNIGVLMRDRISKFAAENRFEMNLKYFDPTYLIRSIDAKGTDSVFCLMLAQSAVHAAMAGCSDAVVGYWNGEFTLVPIILAASERKKLDPDRPLWQSVLHITQQPNFS